MAKKTKKAPAPKPTKGVAYTDGGARPNPGYAGWGVHAYTYASTKDDVSKKRPTTEIVQCVETGNPVVPVVDNYFDRWGSMSYGLSNNEAELKAAVKAIEWAISEELTHLHIRSDSKYVINGCPEWMPKWKANGWAKSDGSPIKNMDGWQEYDSVKTLADDTNLEITWEWVKGHNGNFGNTVADSNATRGVIESRRLGEDHDGDMVTREHLHPRAGYVNPKTPDYNRLIAGRKLYWQSNNGGPSTSKDGRRVYLCGDYGDTEDNHGKQLSTTSFSVAFLEKPDPVIDSVLIRQDEVSIDGYSDPMEADLSLLLGAKLYKELVRDGGYYLDRTTPKFSLFTPDDVQVTKQHRPAKRAFMAMEKLEFYQRKLEEFLEDPVRYKIGVKEITDVLYDREQGKKGEVLKLKPDWNGTDKAVSLKADHLVSGETQEGPVVLTLGIDLPRKMYLQGLAKQGCKAYVITWPEGPHGFRYATVIESLGGVGFYVGGYSNLVLI